MFLRELETARARRDRLQRRVDVNGGVSAGEALAELETTLEELRVIEEELRVPNVQLTGLYEIDADRDRWQDLFEHAPVAAPVLGPGGTVTALRWALHPVTAPAGPS